MSWNWETMTPEEKDTISKLMEQQPTLAAKQRVAKSVGMPVDPASLMSQIRGSGQIVEDYKRGRATTGRKMVVIPPVVLPEGRKTGQVAVEPECVREVAEELLRIAETLD